MSRDPLDLMSLEIDLLIQRMEWAAANGLSELVETHGGWRVRLRRDRSDEISGLRAATAAEHSPDPPQPQDRSEAPTIAAPLAGLCHLAPDPGAAPFVKPGDRIEVGRTVCVIEAMKMMVGVASEVAGVVDAVLVSDGATVEAQTPLVRLRR